MHYLTRAACNISTQMLQFYVIVWEQYQLDSTCVLLQTLLCSICSPIIMPWTTGILHLMMKKSARLAESGALVCRLCGC